VYAGWASAATGLLRRARTVSNRDGVVIGVI